MITDVELAEWMKYAKTGDRLVYHRGIHLFGIDGQKRKVAVLVHAAAQDGLLFLAQRRLEDGGFQYEATRLSSEIKEYMRSWITSKLD